MRTLVQWLKRLWNTPVEFYGVDRPEPQAGPWHGLMLFVVLLVVLGLLWLIRYLPARTYLVQLPSMSPQGRTAAGALGGHRGEETPSRLESEERPPTAWRGAWPATGLTCWQGNTKTKGRVKRCRHEARSIVQARRGEGLSTRGRLNEPHLSRKF
jgi:hypothetical protein